MSPLEQEQFDFDVLAVGRANLDLYAQQPGLEFTAVDGWDAMVGGSPTNVAVAASRLGLRTAVFTAVGADLVGDWVVQSLKREGVDTRFVARKYGPHTSLALRAQLSPDHPLAFYRHDPADIHLTVSEAAALPIDRTRALLISADALSRGSTPDACWTLIGAGRTSTQTSYLDLDLRDVNWRDLDAYSTTVNEAVEHVDVVLGTEAEFAALLGLTRAGDGQQIVQAVRAQVANRSGQLIIVKQGDRGATALVHGQTIVVGGYPVEEANSIGAGDSFAAGLIDARLAGHDVPTALAFASACAAITVSRLACSSAFPRRDEVDRFLERHALVTNYER